MLSNILLSNYYVPLLPASSVRFIFFVLAFADVTLVLVVAHILLVLAGAVSDLFLSVSVTVVFHCSITHFDVLLFAALPLLIHQVCQVPLAWHQAAAPSTIWQGWVFFWSYRQKFSMYKFFLQIRCSSLFTDYCLVEPFSPADENF